MDMEVSVSRTTVAILAIVLAACEPTTQDDCVDCDDNQISPFTGTDTDASSSNDDGQPLSHDDDIQPIWDDKCGGCHLDGSDAGGVNLDDGFGAMVGVPSEGVPSMLLVSPGDPEGSYLWHKLDDTHRGVGGDGIAMPKNDTLKNAQLNRIYDWIAEGAEP